MDISSHIHRIEKLLEARRLLHPQDSVPSSMALFRAIASLCGYTGGSPRRVGEGNAQGSSHEKQLQKAIGRSDHYVFVLVDGLGLNLRPLFPKGGFFDTFLHGELRSIFPSTTASVLTSMATGLWPERHAIPAWNTYLPERARTVKPILFQDRVTEKPLGRFGITPQEVYPFPSILPDLPVKCRTYLPSGISKETYARYCRGDTPFRGYRDLSDAAKKVIAHVGRSTPPSYTYLYLPQVDKNTHEKGLTSVAVAETVAEVDRQLSRLRAEVGRKARIIVTADHGLIDVRRDAYLVLRDEDELMSYLVVAPTGESRLPIFHLKKGVEEGFLDAAERVLGEHFSLVPREWVDERRFFGPHGCSKEMLSRLGDYIGIPADSAVLEYVPAGSSPRNFFGFHGSLSPDEMRLPLFLA
jgi:hypothetical protein